MERQCLDVRGLQEYLGISRARAYELVNSAGFPAARVGRRIIVLKAALDAWLAAGGTRAEVSDHVQA